MSESELLALCESIARNAHAGQFRRDGVTPYITHPEKVASLLNDNREKCAAWLHDVLEDTTVTYHDLFVANIPLDVLDAVKVLSKNITGRSLQDYMRAVSRNRIARKVKIADMLANLTDSPTEKQVARYTAGIISLA